MELICPAGTPAAFREAVDAGANAVYCGFRDETNARNFPGLNFSREELAEAIVYAKKRGVQTFVALNTFMRAGNEDIWYRGSADAIKAGADALILADFGLMAHVAEHHPQQRIHVSVQASASNADAVNFLVDAFGAKRVVLPRTLTIADIARLARQIRCEIEIFVFGGLCVMAEGRCSLSSYTTGKSPNMNGVCSPASHVRYRQDGQALVSELGEYTINRFPAGEAAGYPTLCKGRFEIADDKSYAFEDPVSLDVMDQIDALREAGVSALKIEGRQRGKAYVAEVVSTLHRALSAGAEERGRLLSRLRLLSEGQRTTVGAYEKRWR
ncbi:MULTISPECIES: ubiquinone anaerobic biosynthesis protein UbiU [Agrobacterium]|uniref:Ubiquinone biosynthesis protein UbiU n=2 Tax=Agrobacterium TaxID=357 RepID=A0A9W5F7X4_9HYPH|nr:MULTISPECIES: peptidase U32 family protein [Agrobacterium]HCJ72756.1 U32 family peptidase [Agrobacterium sp.]OJH51797.1 protease [Agrobacterium pusense]OJH59815.1 protease [Agrobacterium pusense]RAL97297.1 U32 family peptidase [Agrobacterium sp. MS2]CUX02715.1 peptidase (collagenase-like) [Agrobacterium genomosp. 2 str. CFBP 5494]